MIEYLGNEPPNRPIWSDRWPGRLKAELDHLSYTAGPVYIDEVKLAERVLRIEFSWPLSSGKKLNLEATYPDTFPRFRPHVRLRDDPTTFPDRHVGPDGEICLLGRDSRFWLSKMTLADLLYSNLENALTAAGDEDPQGEPIEVWWNGAQRNEYGNFLLLDSSWDLTGFDEGVAEIAYRFELIDGKASFHGVVDKIWVGAREQLLFERTFQAPPMAGLSRTAATWHRNDTLPLPNSGQLGSLLPRLDYKGRYEQTSFGSVRISLTVVRTELRHGMPGDGFVCVVTVSRGSRSKRRESRLIVPVFRAGEQDIGYRVPASQVLRQARVSLIGLGAIGSPLALELARNGVAHLTTLDHDIVEPGNTVRWALGASAWGKRKATSLEEFIRAEYPSTEPVSLDVFIGVGGSTGGEAETLDQTVFNADLIVDASASTGVTRYLSDLCRQHGKTMISVAATASVKGGTVSLYRPNSGCPVCREFAYDDGDFAMPPGADDYSELTQPPGCAENTFTGASFDLQELTLQAVRMVVEVLEGTASNQSQVLSLSLHDGTRRIPPLWSAHDLPLSTKCTCNG